MKRKKLWISHDFGRLHVGFGWYWGETLVLLKLAILEYIDPTLWIINIQIAKLGLCVGWEI